MNDLTQEFDEIDALPETTEHDHKKVKVALCPACNGWITQACFPYAETDKECQKEFAAHAKAGDIIDVMTLGEAKKLTYCEQKHK